MRGTATLPQGKREPLVVRDKVGKTPGELGVSNSVECDIFFLSVLWHCWLDDGKGVRPVKNWFVGGDSTGALHFLYLQLSLPLPSSLASMKPANPDSHWKIGHYNGESKGESFEAGI